MRYEGPIYRPPSEADSLLIQATVGCPHNHCTFCMVYKDGPKYRVRPVEEIKEDMLAASLNSGEYIKTLFLPAGNTIAMNTDDLVEICQYARTLFPMLTRITVYGSSAYIVKKGAVNMKRLAEAGLSRIHVGLESGDNTVLKRIKKGTTAEEQIRAGQMVMEAGIELSLYVILGIGGIERTSHHSAATATAINVIGPDFVRLRTFVPKKNTPLLQDITDGIFQMLGPHGVLKETADLIQRLDCHSYLASDHYTNYINVVGNLPVDKERILTQISESLKKNESQFRPFFVGDQ